MLAPIWILEEQSILVGVVQSTGYLHEHIVSYLQGKMQIISNLYL